MIIVPVGTGRRVRAGVVVGIDGASSDALALDFAAREASGRGETLHIVHAWTETVARRRGAVHDEVLDESLSNARQAMLDQAVKIVEGSYPSLSYITHLVREQPARALLNIAASAEMLVVGSSQRRGAARLRTGSVSHATLINVVCPTAVNPAEGLT